MKGYEMKKKIKQKLEIKIILKFMEYNNISMKLNKLLI